MINIKKYKFKNSFFENINREIELKQLSNQKIINELNKLNVGYEYKIRFSLYEQFKNYLVPFYGKLRANLKNFFLNQVNEKNPKISRFISKNELKEKINFLNSSKRKLMLLK